MFLIVGLIGFVAAIVELGGSFVFFSWLITHFFPTAPFFPGVCEWAIKFMADYFPAVDLEIYWAALIVALLGWFVNMICSSFCSSFNRAQ